MGAGKGEAGVISPHLTDSLMDIRIHITQYALKESTERLFPDSRHRSKRILKKLIKRHGGQFKKVPTIWYTPQAIYIHPFLYNDFKEQIRQAKENPNRKDNRSTESPVPSPKLDIIQEIDISYPDKYTHNADIRYGSYGLRLMSSRNTFRVDSI